MWDVSATNSATGTLVIAVDDVDDVGAAPGWELGNGITSRPFNNTPWGNFGVLNPLHIAIHGDINKPPPTVTGVRIVSTPPYGLGKEIRVQVTFDTDVTVTGTPCIKIRLSSGEAGERSACYESGGGTTRLIFVYEVVALDSSTQGVAVVANMLDLNSGTIRGADAVDASPAYPGLNHNSDHKVETTAPRFDRATVDRTTLRVTFNEALDPDSAPAGSAFR